MLRRETIRLFLFVSLAAIAVCVPAPAQPPGPGPQSADSAAALPGFPVVQLIYYAGWEGDGWEENAYFELDEWTPQKDVVITAKWIQPNGLTAPGARAPGESPQENLRARKRALIPTHRAWTVQYVDALLEGESHLFIRAVGLPKVNHRLYGPEEVISYLHTPDGWQQLGVAAQAYRHWQLYESKQQPAPPPADDVHSR